MKISTKLCKFISVILSVCIMSSLFSCVAVNAANSQSGSVNFYTYADTTKSNTRINAFKVSGIDTLVIPSSVSKNSVAIFCNSTAKFTVKGALAKKDFVSGKSLDLTALCKNGDYFLEFSDGKNVYKLKILFESKIPSIFLLSEDPANKGREWVESSYDKSNKAKGSMIMLSKIGQVVHSGELTQIKGRGNTTWGLEKRPYQIKLGEKVDLLRTGDKSNKSKTWVLLANYLDPVGIRNTLALNLGSALGMPVNIQGESVNLYYDGEYRGMYMLAEKVETGSGRVPIADLEEENEKANPGKKLEDFPTANGSTSNGATYTYCKGMVSPSDITGGYLLEMDFKVRALEEKCYIRTSRGNYVVVKSPEYASKEEMNYIATLYQEFEDSIFNGGVNSKTNKKYSDYVDKHSLVCYYIINEFSKARDCFSSSAYLSKKPGEDKFTMGPLWDYDMSFGKGSMEDYYIDDDPYGITVRNVKMGSALLNIKDFRDTLREVYKNDFEPLIKNVVLGDENAVSEKGNLHSLKYYKKLLAASGHANSALWYGGKSWSKDSEILYDFVSQRHKVMNDYMDRLWSNFGLPENRYYDVCSWEWYYDTVTKASKASLLQGNGHGYFYPEDPVTRAQATQAVFNMSGVKDVDFKLVYADVSEETWYSDAAVWAAINDYLMRNSDGTFRPDNAITREEFVYLLYKFSGSPFVVTNHLKKFADDEHVTAKSAVEWALEEGIILGAENSINPKGAMTRAEMAAVLLRYQDVYKKLKK